MAALDITTPLTPNELAAAAKSTRNARPKPQPIVPVTSDAPPALSFKHPKHGIPTAAWEYRDAAGALLSVVTRFDRPDGGKEILPVAYCDLGNGRRGWRAIAPSEPRTLYGLDRLAARPLAAVVLIVEGEKCADAAAELFPDAVACTSSGGARAAAKTDWAPLAERHVTIWPDNDEDGKAYARDVARLAVEAGAASVGIVNVPASFPAKWDLADTLPEGVTIDDLRQLIAAAEACRPEPVESESGADTDGLSDADSDREIERLAALSPRAYERERATAAKRLGMRASVLDRTCAALRDAGVPPPGRGRPLELPEPELWLEAVDGASLIDEMRAAVRKYVVLSDDDAVAVALWAIHTHTLDAFTISPRLAITSAEKGCGKTTLLDVVAGLVRRPLAMANVTAAATFRAVEVARPTLLIDEADTFLGENDDLRGVLNSGHRRGGQTVRVVGDDHEPRQFSTFAACAIAMIGSLPPTLEDRSVSIRLTRRRSDESVAPFRVDRTEDLQLLARREARWAADTFESLRRADPAMPAGLANRAADNWRPLLAIADAAGGQWPARVREVASRTINPAQSLRERLLADIRTIFNARVTAGERYYDRLASTDLAAALHALEGAPWPEFGLARKPISVHQIAGLLSPWLISPQSVRFGSTTAKGYRRAQFEDAFERFLPKPDLQTVTPAQAAENRGTAPDSEPSQAKSRDRSKMPGSPRVHAGCDVVTDENLRRGETEALWTL